MTKRAQLICDGKGNPAYAVVPWPEYRQLMEDAGRDFEESTLIALADAQRGGTRLPASVADRIVAGESTIKVLREWRGLTQDQLAKRAGLSSQYISQIETGRRNAGGRKSISALASALNIGVDALLDLVE